MTSLGLDARSGCSPAVPYPGIHEKYRHMPCSESNVFLEYILRIQGIPSEDVRGCLYLAGKGHIEKNEKFTTRVLLKGSANAITNRLAVKSDKSAASDRNGDDNVFMASALPRSGGLRAK